MADCPSVRPIGSATTGRDGLELCRELRPRVVLVDLDLPDMDGFAVAEELAALRPTPAVLLLTTRGDEYTLYRLRRTPVRSLLCKNGNMKTHLRTALAEVLAGRSYFPPEVLAIEVALRRDPRAIGKILAPKDIALLALLGRGDGRISMLRAICCLLLTLGLETQTIARGSLAPDASQLVDDDDGGLLLAKRWRRGDAIPNVLLEWRWRYPGHFLIPSDTMFLYQKIDNYPLLEEIIFLRVVDERIFDCAVKSALKLGGLRHFYRAFDVRCRRNPCLKAQPQFQRIAAWSTVKQVAFSGLSLGQSLSKNERDEMQRQIVAELERGAHFDEIARKYATQTTHYTSDRITGRGVPVVRTHVGISQDYAIYSKDRTDSFREPFELPLFHADALLRGATGQILVFFDQESKRTLIYQIHEVYSPEERRRPVGIPRS